MLGTRPVATSRSVAAMVCALPSSAMVKLIPPLAARDSLRARVEQDFYAILTQDLEHLGSHILVFFTQKLRPGLDHRYLDCRSGETSG